MGLRMSWTGAVVRFVSETLGRSVLFSRISGRRFGERYPRGTQNQDLAMAGVQLVIRTPSPSVIQGRGSAARG